MTKVKFMQWNCTVEKAKYQGNDRTALRLIDEEDGCDVLMATVNIPHATLDQDEVLIKNWSENEGVLSALVASGVVKDTGKTVRTGFVFANVCKLLV